jgi:translation initiation factor IF-3
VRLIDDQDQQLGIVEIGDALSKAREAGLDLVEVAPQSRPPVCRIMDYGKWKYAQNKKEQKSKSHRHETELKEIRIKTPKISEHDLDIKVNRARDFLARGDRVQFILRFRGRELAHIDEGEKIFIHIKQSLTEVAKVDQDFRREGKRISMLLAPGGQKKAGESPKPAAAASPKPHPAAEAPKPPAAQ